MPRTTKTVPFVLANVLVWLLMTATIVLVPDVLERWLPLEVARVVGWAAATFVWMILVERAWQRRVHPMWRYAVQIVLWMSAAFVAVWISENARLNLR